MPDLRDAGASGDQLRLRVSVATWGDAEGGRHAIEQEGDLDRQRFFVDPVRRQVGDAVRCDRPSKVDRLATGAAQGELCRPHVRHRLVETRR